MTSSFDNIYKSFVTVKEMLHDRIDFDNIDHPHYKELDEIVKRLNLIGEDEFSAISQNKTLFSINVDSKIRLVYFLQRFFTKDIKKCVSKNEDGSVDSKYIVILKDKSTTTNMRSLHDHFATLGVPKHNIEVFELKELIYNISKHSLVPKHILIPAFMEENINTILKQVNVKSKTQLPVILKTDPMARYLDAKPGDLVKVLRFPITSAEYVFYRLCV
jgi:DNA-directed RNA polymerase I, II, and III subunit RPABC1